MFKINVNAFSVNGENWENLKRFIEKTHMKSVNRVYICTEHWFSFVFDKQKKFEKNNSLESQH